MIHELFLNADAPSVTSELRDQLLSVSGVDPLIKNVSWALRPLCRGSMVNLVRIHSGRFTMTNAKWGRWTEAGDRTYCDDAAPDQVQRGLIAASEIRVLEEGATKNENRKHMIDRTGRGWVTLGCSWNGNLDRPEFSILTTPATGYLATRLTMMPILVPADKRATWMDPANVDEFLWPDAIDDLRIGNG